MDERRQFADVVDAFRADPSYLPAQFAVAGLVVDRLSITQSMRFIARTPGISPADSTCMARMFTALPGATVRELADLAAAERRYGPSACFALLRAEWESDLPVSARPPDLNRVEWPRVVAAAGNPGPLWVTYVGALASAGDTAGAIAAARRGLALAHDANAHFTLSARLGALLLARGDSVDAAAVRRELAEWAARDGGPAARYWGFDFRWFGLTDPADRAALDGARAILAAHHAAHRIAGQWMSFGAKLEDSGDPLGAARVFRRALLVADSLGSQPLRVHALIALGRAYTKAGRWNHAIRALDLAGRVCDPHDLYYAAEVHHNLAHAYQGEGRLSLAVAEVNRFVAIADAMPGDGIHMISLYDAGTIRWEAGLHVGARAAFDSMVAVVDARHANYFYAGDYYERIGDLARALRYYRMVPPTDAEEGARALSGLARVYDALGMRDSAEAAARTHDREVQTPEEVPLLPGVLARHGHVARALRISRAWADTQIVRGNLAGAVRAELQLAQLLLGAGAAPQAADEAQRAGALATRANLFAERGRAMTTESGAELLLGQVGVARRDADVAVRETRDQGTDADRRDAEAALGDALAASGRTADALAAYGASARIIESMARTVTADLARASFHARQLDVFDRAVALLLAMPPSSARTAELLRWVQRRNSAAFPDGDFHRAPLTAGEIRARLGRDRVLVDYVLLDSAGTAIVATRSAITVVPLAATAATVARLVADINRPFSTVYLGRVDLSRAIADTAAAGALARMLVQPIAAELRGHASLIVVPDGALHLLPFDLLPLTDSTLVVDRYAVSLLPSVRLLSAAPDRPAVRGASLLLVGGDAPGAEREVAAVHRLWTAGPVRVLGARDATATAIRRALPRYTVLHFATHAVVDEADPLASRLVLSPDSAAGGFLQLSDIERTPSHARLVVLSACESENGRSYAGVGPIGLAREFLVGGAHAVVATQWPVTAAAADFMRAFYTRLVAGDPVDEALRRAKLAMRRDSRTSNPVDWAGFVLVSR